MAIIHLSGTKLAPRKAKAPLNRKFMYSVGFVFLIAMHLYIPNLGGAGLALPFNISTWLSLSYVIAIGLFHMAKTRQVRYSKLSIVLFITCIFLTIPIFYPLHNDWTSFLPRLIAVWSGWFFFLILQQFLLSNQHKQRLLWFIVIATAMQTILSYLQLFSLLPKDIIGYNDFTQLPFGVFQQSSVMVSFLSTGVILSGYLLARQQRKYGQRISRTLFLYVLPIFTVPQLFLLSQGLEWIGAAIGFLFVVVYLYRFSTPQRLAGWVALSVAGAGLGLILFSTIGGSISNSDTPEISKTMLFPQTIDMLVEKPFTGYGYGQIETAYALYTARQHQLNPNYPAGYGPLQHPQNEILYWGIEGGIIPILGLIFSSAMVLFKIYSARKGTRLAIFSLFIPIIIHSQIGMPFYLSAIHWLILIILLYWVDQRTSKYRIVSFSTISSIALKNVALIVPLVTTTCMGLALQANFTLYRFDKSYPKDTAILSQVMVPFSETIEFNWQLRSNLLKQGLVNKDEDLITQYINWSVIAIKNAPKEKYYRHLILAYLGLGEISKAEQIRSEASFLFPNNDFSMLDIEPIIKPTKTEQDTINIDK
ncbi:Wzy polymerase domain-containing protein [Vibrio sp. TH_r3]|uniref:PglL family O-oligosaccharyltransferase n=1 Tax=Vibrio sp. TH_r3 TaxID=3082084 RepID=UPI002953B574|nr:Wzy polymerase domain-containing protein [Vibrio sp. TH_r3]MDV7105962.1 Wzy polymerase domain-containing protein [Vibrio sp. TH_r3]